MSETRGAPSIDDVRCAAERIAPHVHRTPVLRSRTLDAELGCSAHFKCENLQKVGAFKARGATNAVLSLGGDEARRGVVTHSSGNHGQAVAYAAAMRDVPCTVVMPKSAPSVKVAAVRGYGAAIEFCERSEREAVADRVLAETGGTFVHPFTDPRVIAGQGTACLELLDEVGELDAIVTPVGGGGLLVGTTIVAGALCADARVYGAEPLAVDDAHRSLVTGERQPAVIEPETWCDGLLTALGEINFAVLRAGGVEVITLEEGAILDAARFFLERMKIVVEPSGATVLAALRARPELFRGKQVGAIISGGNTDFAWLAS